MTIRIPTVFDTGKIDPQSEEQVYEMLKELGEIYVEAAMKGRQIHLENDPLDIQGVKCLLMTVAHHEIGDIVIESMGKAILGLDLSATLYINVSDAREVMNSYEMGLGPDLTRLTPNSNVRRLGVDSVNAQGQPARPLIALIEEAEAFYIV